MKIPEKPPAVQDFGKILQERNVDFAKVLSAKLDDSRYLSFEDTKYRPVPEQIKAVGGDRLVWWIAIMFGRIPRFPTKRRSELREILSWLRNFQRASR